MGPRFDDYMEFLRFLMKRKGWLQRDLAAQMRMSAAWASQILNGKRTLQLDLAKKIAWVMELDDQETWQLLDLVTEQAATAGRARSPNQTAASDDWYVGVVRELLRCDNYTPDPVWVAAAVRPRIDVDDAQSAMELLQERGFLDQDFMPVMHGDQTGVPLPSQPEPMVARLRRTLDTVQLAPMDPCLTTRTVALSEAAYEALMAKAEQWLTEAVRASANDDPVNRVYEVSFDIVPVSLFTDSSAHPAEIED